MARRLIGNAVTDQEAEEAWRSTLNGEERSIVIARLERLLQRRGVAVPSRKGHNRFSYYMALRRALKRSKEHG